MLNRRKGLDRNAKNVSIIVLDSDSESDSDFDPDFDTELKIKEKNKKKIRKKRTWSSRYDRSSPPPSSPSSSFQTFDNLFKETSEESKKDEDEDEEDVELKKAMAESLRFIEIETQNKAYEQSMLEDSILKTELEEEKNRGKRYKCASLRIFNQKILPNEPTVFISVLLPSCKISKTWLITTPCKTLLEWVSTELINSGEEYMEHEIQLGDRITPGCKITYDSDSTLAEAGFTESTVLVVQYLSYSPKNNKKQRV